MIDSCYCFCCGVFVSSNCCSLPSFIIVNRWCSTTDRELSHSVPSCASRVSSFQENILLYNPCNCFVFSSVLVFRWNPNNCNIHSNGCCWFIPRRRDSREMVMSLFLSRIKHHRLLDWTICLSWMAFERRQRWCDPRQRLREQKGRGVTGWITLSLDWRHCFPF